MNLVKAIIRNYLQEKFGRTPTIHQSSCMFPERRCTCKRLLDIDYDTELITGGYMDSFSMVSVLVFIERQFDVKIPDKEATPDNFNSVNKISDLVDKYLP